MCSEIKDGSGRSHTTSPDQFLTNTLARCLPCAPGEYCGPGTYVDPEDTANEQLVLRRCPAGSYCPTPQEQYACEAGTYCVSGSLEPTSCDVGGALIVNALIDLPQPRQTLVEQLYEKGDPLGGNFCPEQAVSPAGTCVFFCVFPLRVAAIMDPYG